MGIPILVKHRLYIETPPPPGYIKSCCAWLWQLWYILCIVYAFLITLIITGIFSCCRDMSVPIVGNCDGDIYNMRKCLQNHLKITNYPNSFTWDRFLIKGSNKNLLPVYVKRSRGLVNYWCTYDQYRYYSYSCRKIHGIHLSAFPMNDKNARFNMIYAVFRLNMNDMNTPFRITIFTYVLKYSYSWNPVTDSFTHRGKCFHATMSSCMGNLIL